MRSVIRSLLSLGLLCSLCRYYLDPGTGSMLLQILLAALLAVPFLIKAYWKKIKAFFTRSAGKTETEETNEPSKHE